MSVYPQHMPQTCNASSNDEQFIIQVGRKRQIFQALWLLHGYGTKAAGGYSGKAGKEQKKVWLFELCLHSIAQAVGAHHANDDETQGIKDKCISP